MNAHDPDTLRAVIARRRGLARLRAATAALGAASLVAAGAVTYQLAGTPAHTVASGTAATTTAPGTSLAHSTSGGSAVSSATSRSGATSVASSGSAHAASGGS